MPSWPDVCDRMVALVTQMLELNQKLQDATLDHEKTLWSRQVEAVDAAIDALMYELYGLTGGKLRLLKDERGLIELHLFFKPAGSIRKPSTVLRLKRDKIKKIIQAAVFTATGALATFFFTHDNSFPLNSNEFMV